MSKQGASKSYGTVLAELDSFLGQLSKSAAEEGDKDTAHPSKGVDDQDRPATEGARSAENERDVTAMVGVQNINDAAPATDEEPDAVAMTTAKTTGKDPANETASVKSTKDDPGSSHPSAKVAEFLGQVKSACAKFGAEKIATEIGNSLMADIAVLSDNAEKQASENGLEQAAAAGSNQAEVMFKEAMAETMPNILSYVEKQASEAAVMLRDFYAGVEQGAQKKAEGNPEEGIPGEAGGEGALPQEDLAQLAAAAGGPGGAPMPEEAMMAGGEGLGGPGGAQGDEEVIQALSEALADAGITPEELAQAVASSQKTASHMTIEQRKNASDIAKLAMCEVNSHRNLQSVGRTHVKKASLSLAYAMRQMIKDVTGK